MSKITQSHRIERIFGIREISALTTFTSSGQPLTVAELAFPSEGGGSGSSSIPDDAYLVVTNVGTPCGVSVVRDGLAVFENLIPAGHTIVIDLAETFRVSWSGPLRAVTAYLPRYAVFEGHQGLERHSLVDNALLEDDLLSAIMACLRHTADPSNPREFEMFARQLLAAACSCLARSHSTWTNAPRLPRLALSEDQRRVATDYILSNLDSGLSMHRAAALCGLPYRQFSRAFKVSLGASPHDWAMATRVDRAKRLMQDPSLRLSDIALMVGFCDQSHLNRVFVRFSSCTPGEWRRTHKAGTTSDQRAPA